ncbi:MAG: transmission trait enhancer LetE [Bacteroidetes bacterium]|nr:transmission trait enhancer LetE [Bacteroidota bacterium]
MDTQIEADLRLKLHIDYPDLEDCYVDGYACALAGIDEFSNPYANDSIEGEYWTEGWWAGFYSEKALFNLEGPVIEKQQPKPEDHKVAHMIVRILEISGVIAVSALVGYQIWDLVA